jgi:hypothetical protein
LNAMFMFIYSISWDAVIIHRNLRTFVTFHPVNR